MPDNESIYLAADVYKNEFRIQQLRLENYRCFGAITLDDEPSFKTSALVS
ncbi:MAG: hypothetical protein WC028_10430 [Candidatus Obscuribacterales bacterium]